MRSHIFLFAAAIWLLLTSLAWRSTRSRSLAVWNAACTIWMLTTAFVFRPELLPPYLSGTAIVVMPVVAGTLMVCSWRIGKLEAARKLQDPTRAAVGRRLQAE